MTSDVRNIKGSYEDETEKNKRIFNEADTYELVDENDMKFD